MKFLIQITVILLLIAGCGRETPDGPGGERADGSPGGREKILRAGKHLAAGQVKEAELLFLEAWEEDSASETAAAGLCRIALLTNRNTEAIRWGEEAVRINPTLAEAWEDLGKGQKIGRAHV